MKSKPPILRDPKELTQLLRNYLLSSERSMMAVVVDRIVKACENGWSLEVLGKEGTTLSRVIEVLDSLRIEKEVSDQSDSDTTAIERWLLDAQPLRTRIWVPTGSSRHPDFELLVPFSIEKGVREQSRRVSLVHVQYLIYLRVVSSDPWNHEIEDRIQEDLAYMDDQGTLTPHRLMSLDFDIRESMCSFLGRMLPKELLYIGCDSGSRHCDDLNREVSDSVAMNLNIEMAQQKARCDEFSDKKSRLSLLKRHRELKKWTAKVEKLIDENHDFLSTGVPPDSLEPLPYGQPPSAESQIIRSDPAEIDAEIERLRSEIDKTEFDLERGFPYVRRAMYLRPDQIATVERNLTSICSECHYRRIDSIMLGARAARGGTGTEPSEAVLEVLRERMRGRTEDSIAQRMASTIKGAFGEWLRKNDIDIEPRKRDSVYDRWQAAARMLGVDQREGVIVTDKRREPRLPVVVVREHYSRIEMDGEPCECDPKGNAFKGVSFIVAKQAECVKHHIRPMFDRIEFCDHLGIPPGSSRKSAPRDVFRRTPFEGMVVKSEPRKKNQYWMRIDSAKSRVEPTFS